MSAPQSVYFIKPIGMDGPIKIGVSISPDGRRSTLETWTPFPLEVVAELPGCLKLEMRFHAMFIASHTHREWFTWSPELAAVIDAINAGTFDIETLPEGKRLWEAKSKGTRSPQWRYERSVHARLKAPVDAGCAWAIIWPTIRAFNIPSLTVEELEAVKPEIEAFVATIRAEYPTIKRRHYRTQARSIAA